MRLESAFSSLCVGLKLVYLKRRKKKKVTWIHPPPTGPKKPEARPSWEHLLSPENITGHIYAGIRWGVVSAASLETGPRTAPRPHPRTDAILLFLPAGRPSFPKVQEAAPPPLRF